MKKNMMFVTATEAGILVGVKTKLSNDDLEKVSHYEESVKNLLKDVHAVIVFVEPTANDFNFAIGSYSSGEVSIEAIHAEASNMMNAMDQLKIWLKATPMVKENKKEFEKAPEDELKSELDKAIDDAFESLKERFPDAGFCVIGVDLENKTIPIVSNIPRAMIAEVLFISGIANERS